MEFFIVVMFVYYIIFILLIRITLFCCFNPKRATRRFQTSQSLTHPEIEQIYMCPNPIDENNDILPPYTLHDPMILSMVYQNSISINFSEIAIDISTPLPTYEEQYENNNNVITKSIIIPIEEISDDNN